MPEPVYDKHAQFYLDFIDRHLASGTGYVTLLLSTLTDCLQGRLRGARVCDLCCGEGYVSRQLIKDGAREVVGIDLSSALIATAKQRANEPGLSYRVDDAQVLASVPDADFDIVVCQQAMMDVADHRKLFATVRRVLSSGGRFVFSMLHPCFEGRPFHVNDAPPFVIDEAGERIAYAVRRYASEGYWESGGSGVRGHMGAYHRTLSTYMNDLIASGFVLDRVAEPLAGADASKVGLFAEVPTVLVLAAHAA